MKVSGVARYSLPMSQLRRCELNTRDLGALALLVVAVGCSPDTRNTDDRVFIPPLQGPGEKTAQFLPPGPLGVGEVKTAPRRVPALSGGTLTVIASANVAIASDPDLDRVLVMNLDSRKVTPLPLNVGDEPGRVIEHGTSVSVLLRGSGEVLTFSATDPAQFSRRAVCAAPRGLAFDAARDRLVAACAGGEVMTLPQTGGSAQLLSKLDSDLRDVVITGPRLQVTRFRTAEVLQIDPANGRIIGRDRPLVGQSNGPVGAFDRGPFFAAAGEPEVAWRTISFNGRTILAHQRATSNTVSPTPGGYGSDFDPCMGQSSIVTTEVSELQDRAMYNPVRLSGAVLPVDIAVAPIAGPKGNIVALVAAGSHAVRRFYLTSLEPGQTESSPVSPDGCNVPEEETLTLNAQPVAVAFDTNGELLVQTRNPAQIYYRGTFTSFGGELMVDSGNEAFHRDAGGGLACASCHPEGGDDGHTWFFAGLGDRRTQHLAGGIKGTEPFHWSGDMNDFNMLVHEVFTGRMGGPELPVEHQGALLEWIDSVPLVKVSVPGDMGKVARGEVLFNDETVACASCHSGSKAGRATHESVDVGTGEALQVPALAGLALRAPYMHKGCAPTLKDRFGACGGGDAHGKTSQLSEAQIDDLVAYLESL